MAFHPAQLWDDHPFPQDWEAATTVWQSAQQNPESHCSCYPNWGLSSTKQAVSSISAASSAIPVYSTRSAHEAEIKKKKSQESESQIPHLGLDLGTRKVQKQDTLQHFTKLTSAAKGFLCSKTKKALSSNKKFTANEQSLVSCIFRIITGSEKASVQVAEK